MKPEDFPLTEYLDDYFAECDEHLTAIRRNILTLESFLDQPVTDSSLLDELLRRFHTIKGLSGMVGMTEAERLSHQMENYFRALRSSSIKLRSAGMDALIDGVKTLEQVISARQRGTVTPSIDAVVEKIDGVAQEPAEPANNKARSAKESEKLLKAINNGARAWRFEFTPSSKLADRGVNVSVIRARLQNIGELIHAAPLITSNEGVSFEFLVVCSGDEKEFEQWREDGLTWTPETLPMSEEHANAEKPVDAASVNLNPAFSIAPTNIVRVDLSRLDELMQMVGELVINRARLDDSLKRIMTYLPEEEYSSLQETNIAMERHLRNLREGAMRIRMVPVGEIFERMQFVVRDMARESKKQVVLHSIGQETEIDKLVVERMMDPLLHLVRNAVSHGIESPEERVAMGKPQGGRVSLKAYAAGDAVMIEVEDDGQGIDEEKVFKKARLSGIIGDETPASANVFSHTLLDILCTSGFSTRNEADLASGRGVGMAIVKKAVEDLGGELTLDTKKGKGTRFTIQLPLTLAIVDAFIVSIGEQMFAIPQPSVREVIEIEPEMIKIFEHNEIMLYRGVALPLLRMTDVFHLSENHGAFLYALIVGSGPRTVGLVVDRIHTRREIVVRATNDPLVAVSGIAGATELGDGRPVLILNAGDLIERARGGGVRAGKDVTG